MFPRKRVQLICEEPSLTQQQFKDECDVNIIMRRFKDTMGVDYLNRYQGVLNGEFGDFSEVVDYQSALHAIDEARGVFMALPPQIRSRFENDPAKFLDFVHDPKNFDEMVSMGLAEPKLAPPPPEPKTESKAEPKAKGSKTGEPKAE